MPRPGGARLHARGAARPGRLRRGVAGGAAGAAARRWRSRSWSPATRNGRRARRRCSGALDHPHLVRLLEVVHQPRRGGAPRVALVLELLAGGSLAALLARRGRLRPGEVVTAIAPVAAALAHAHGSGVVHGDLSPGNIVFTAEGRPVLTDLGVARVLGETAAGRGDAAPTSTRPSPGRCARAGVGRLRRRGRRLPRADRDRPLERRHARRHPRASPPTGCCPTWPSWPPRRRPELLAVIGRGLAADPHDRGSAAAFALDLRHACRPEPVRLPATGVPTPSSAATGRGPRTELTHQVPGRRPRPAPVVVEPAGRRELLAAADRARPVGRRPPRRAARGALVVAALVLAGWAGVGRWACRAAEARQRRSPPRAAAARSTGRTARPESCVAGRHRRRAGARGAVARGGGRALRAPGGGVRRPRPRGCWTTSTPRAARCWRPTPTVAAALADAGEVLRGFAPDGRAR